MPQGEDLVSPWIHMSRANVFIMSPSSFSGVPAYLNRNCVIYPGMLDRPFPGWTLGVEHERASYEADLKRCLDAAHVGEAP
mmetsp:Transcript_29467/g.78336  ORF Transcript_29467/g.78336 Transcript_29467/m.78336 type:complete len:81 (+) Transcript_29467:89-331(+)